MTLVTVSTGAALGLAVGRASLSTVGMLMVIGALLVVLAVVLARRATARRAAAGELAGGRLTTTSEAHAVADQVSGWDSSTRHSLVFQLGYWPALVLGGWGVGAAVAGVLGLCAATLAVLAAVHTSRRRRLVAVRADHPGATVVLASVVDLGGMRLAQWSTATGACLPFITGGVVLIADRDGLTLERADASRAPVHRWPWAEVEVASRPRPEGALLVLTLRGPPPGARSRAIPVERRRYETTMTVRSMTLAATLAPSPAAAESSAAFLNTRRPVTSDDVT